MPPYCEKHKCYFVEQWGDNRAPMYCPQCRKQEAGRISDVGQPTPPPLLRHIDRPA